MNWRIDISRDARKELAVLPQQVQVRVSKAILALENNPFPHGAKKLKNRDGWRIRVGDYRVIFSIKTEVLVVLVVKIGHRKDVYRD